MVAFSGTLLPAGSLGQRYPLRDSIQISRTKTPSPLQQFGGQLFQRQLSGSSSLPPASHQKSSGQSPLCSSGHNRVLAEPNWLYMAVLQVSTKKSKLTELWQVSRVGFLWAEPTSRAAVEARQWVVSIMWQYIEHHKTNTRFSVDGPI